MNESYGDRTKVVANRLRLARQALGLSQAEICRRTGIAPNTWNNAETQDSRLGVDNAIKLARATGITLDFVYRGELATLPHDLAVKIQHLMNDGGFTRR